MGRELNEYSWHVEWRDPTDLIPYDGNAKNHDGRNIANIAASIKKYGWQSYLVVTKAGVIIIGHGRRLAAIELGCRCPCKVIEDDLTDAEIRELRNVDNLTQDGDYDMAKLRMDLDDMELDFSEFDFDIDDSDEMQDEESGTQTAEEDDFNESEPVEPRAKLGDIYQLGRHRLMCGDATSIDDVDNLMGGEKADLYLTDPPYNVDYTDGHDKERKILNDNFDTDEQCGKELWLPAFTNALLHSKDCCSVYCFMPQGGTHMMMMMMMGEAGWQVKHELIWRKQSIVLNRADYNYQHEPILYGWNKTHKFYGKGMFKNTSVWEFDRPTKSKEHPTMKPIGLLAEILLNSTEYENNVLDTFGGSGSTLIACEQLNRTCYMMELDPHYVDVIIARWEKFTGEEAILLNR